MVRTRAATRRINIPESEDCEGITEAIDLVKSDASLPVHVKGLTALFVPPKGPDRILDPEKQGTLRFK